jgi:hypothetical protein
MGFWAKGFSRLAPTGLPFNLASMTTTNGITTPIDSLLNLAQFIRVDFDRLIDQSENNQQALLLCASSECLEAAAVLIHRAAESYRKATATI